MVSMTTVILPLDFIGMTTAAMTQATNMVSNIIVHNVWGWGLMSTKFMFGNIVQ